jgi:methionyl-tRNA formyltransferase
MALKTIFFCGHKSPYGYAHLKPVLDEFQVMAVVIATDERWAIFQEKLSGKSHEREGMIGQLRELARRNLRRVLLMSKKMISHQESPSIKNICAWNRIPLLQAFDVNEARFIEEISGYKPALFLSAAYPQIFSKGLISVPERGAINFHPSLLPRFRGAHPHFWSLATGEDRGGITAHFMTEKIDDGDIVAQIEFPIGHYYYGEHYRKIVDETPSLVKEVRIFLEDEKRGPIKQDSKNATYFKNDREIHRRMFWGIMSSRDLRNLIRTEQAFCFFRGKKVILKRADTIENNRKMTNGVKVETGTIVNINDTSIVVATIGGFLGIRVLSERGKDLTSQKWARKKRVCIGEKFC